MNEEKHSDHEPEMIRSQLKTAERASKSIKKHTRKKENFKAWVQSKITKASDYLDTAADYLDSKEKEVNEGSLRKWFKGSKSKDGKGGWVNVVTGGTCASDEPGEGTPKCVSSSKRASMTKAERLSAARRKKKADPGQQQKTGAAKPTYVATDKKKKMKESKDLVTISKELDKASKMHKSQANRVRKHIKDMHKEEKQPKNCGCGKDPCITYGKKEMKKESFNEMEEKKVKKLKPNYKHQRYAGSMKFVPFDKIERLDDKIDKAKEDRAQEKYEKGKKAFKTGQKQVPESVYSNWKNEIQLQELSGRTLGNYTRQAAVDAGRKSFDLGQDRGAYEMSSPQKLQDPAVNRSYNKRIDKIEKRFRGISKAQTKMQRKMKPGEYEGKTKKESMYSDWKNEELVLEVKDKKGKGSGTKDACYHKVKSRYSVWPSAYASGALVKCRKKGAANWGNSTKKEEFVPEAARFENETGMTKDQKIARRDERLEKDAGKKPVSMSTARMRAQIHSLKHDGTQKKSKGEKPVRYNQKMQRIDSRPDNPRTTYSHKYGQRITKEETQSDDYDHEDKMFSEVEKMMRKKNPSTGNRSRAERRIAEFKDKRRQTRDKARMEKSYEKPASDKNESNEEFSFATFQQFQEKCWKGYEKKGMKTMFGKRYPNCVKKTKSEEVEVDTSSNVKEEMGNISHTKTKKDGKTIIKVNKNDELDAQAAMKNDPKYILGKTRVQADEGYSANPAQQAAIAIAKKEKKEGDMVAKKKKQKIMSSYDWRSQLESELGHVDECWKTHKKVGMKMKGGKLVPNCVPKNEEFIPELASPLPPPDKDPRKKPDPNQKPQSPYLPGKSPFKNKKIDEAKSPAWQRKAGKSESGGLNAKGVASYRAANPGSKLKTAVTTEPSKLKKGSKSANRRKSFCARMKGMKKRLTSAKTARDPDSRINKSLRKWNC